MDFWKIIKNAILNLIIFTSLFCIDAFVTYKMFIKPQHINMVLKVLEIVSLFAIYIILGAAAGMALAVFSILYKSVDKLEEKAHLVCDPLAEKLVNKLSVSQKSVSIKEFEQMVDDEIKGYKNGETNLRPSLFHRFFVANVLRILRLTLIRDFFSQLNEKGQESITAPAVERYCRERLAGLVVDIFIRERIDFFNYLAYALIAVFLAVPAILYFIIK